MTKRTAAFRKTLRRNGYDERQLTDAEVIALEKAAAEAYGAGEDTEDAMCRWHDVVFAAVPTLT